MLEVGYNGKGGSSNVREKEIFMEVNNIYDDLPQANIGLEGMVGRGD